MQKDECILLDMNDNVIGELARGGAPGAETLCVRSCQRQRAGSRAARRRLRSAGDEFLVGSRAPGCYAVAGTDNKYETHIFCPERPRGKLHRAFSVFLFNTEGKLLLQQVGSSFVRAPRRPRARVCRVHRPRLRMPEVQGVGVACAAVAANKGCRLCRLPMLQRSRGVLPCV
jgi:hypothetical protein